VLKKIVTVTRKGQKTIPGKIREHLCIKEGDELTVDTWDRRIIFKPIHRLEDCAGIFSGMQMLWN
jgi:AbrB family looped-hinge helix DNA binding protein